MSAYGISLEEFRQAIVRHEAQAAANPTWYRYRVAAFAILGYSYLLIIAVFVPILGVLLLIELWSITSGLVALAAAVPIGILWATLYRTHFMRLPEPHGLLLVSTDAPLLFQLVAETSRRLRSPAPDRVLLTWDANCSIAQRPMLGAFGGFRRYLLLGWPLMQALSGEQFHAVLAHELGHLSRNHGRLSSWIERQRITWAILAQKFDRGRQTSTPEFALIGGFARWYVPKIAARGFVLARAHEYEADRCAAALTSVRVAAGAMLRIRATGPRFEAKYTLERLKDANGGDDPPGDFVSALGAALAKPIPAANVDATIRTAWVTPTDYSDTHPSLADRLRHLGIHDPCRMDNPGIRSGPSAGEVFLGDSNTSMGHRLDQAFLERHAADWRSRRESESGARSALATITARSIERPLTKGESWKRLCLTHNLEGPAAAEPLALAFLADHPEHARARFILGRALLDRGDEAGLAHLRAAIGADPGARQLCARLMFDYFWALGRVDEAEAARSIAEAAALEDEAVALERGRMDASIPLLAHGLAESEVVAIQQQLALIPHLLEVCLVRREFRIRHEMPEFLLLLLTSRPRVAQDSPEASKMARLDEAMVEQMMRDIDWPEGTRFMILGLESDSFLKEARRVPGAVLFKR